LANPLAQQVEKILAGAVGEFIAKATVKKNCELIGATPDNLSDSQLTDLAAHIEKSVSFFSGKETGLEVAEKIRSLGG
jgi:cytochrome c553